MTSNGILQIAIFCGLVLLCVKPLGGYMARLFQGERVFLSPVLGPIERLLYRAGGVDAKSDQHWLAYGVAMLLFNLAGLLVTYLVLRFQDVLPLNPQGLPALSPDLAFNTAASFTTNTNWQSYVGEATMSYFSQMVGLAVHNFTSAATGIALAIAFIRAFSRASMKGLGNFWVDITRVTLYVLLPISIVLALVLVWQGMPQNLDLYVQATTVEGASQTIAQGPVASQVAIKMLGTNGGGFFNANAAHPYENPTPLSNLLQMVAIFAIGASLTNTFGRMVKDQRQGWAILAAMGIMFLVGLGVVYSAESAGNPQFTAAGIDQQVTVLQPGGNMEGKEVRFGIVNSAIFATTTTAASCGAVNAMHSSFTPLGGLIPMINIQLGEIIVGGVGAGLYGMLLFVVLAVFIAGQMVGRTPEYLGKKIESREVRLAFLALLVLPFSILGFTAIAAVSPDGLKGLLSAGPHGFSEMLYAYSSATGNNGSAFAGLTANSPFYNTTLGIAMLIGRFLMIMPMLGIAGSLVTKKKLPPSAGTFPTHTPLFVGLLVGVILIVGGLEFFPSLALGPIVEHFALQAGQLF
ncbi:potassium-transporting ATPase subunit KdpA [Oleomonas cavernae]|uniref:Potassium-transporting ATPase potassium-binding subunit n=1 Tax=Oleomonas cavernae TaxID=2320859 RepID=A0A418WB32_9PROT|nr:potassium-transporting ATPase subunit KdpA [Oleomonas cavernae]RJF87148.1 potassium-transporting ATPase subunit KdpA [Oleomonas cavernae]